MPSNPRGVDSCTYELDRRLIIQKLSPEWDRVAIEHGAPELRSPRPIGRPLLMFLDDATTVHIYELLFARVSRTNREITIPIRCDGPVLRRYLDLTIAPGPSGGFSVTSLLVRSERRRPIMLFAPEARRRPDPVFVCSWCQRMLAHHRWVEVEEGAADLQLFQQDEQPQIKHTVCDDCERFMLTMLKEDSKFPPL